MFSKLWAWLDGKKMNIGGIATILTGLGKIGFGYSNNKGFDMEGWQMILAGWALIAGKSAIAKTE